jgi:C4-dicarboxylate-specific signal transduction histidine kinase
VISLALSGWLVALALVAVQRRRAALVADAEHELRGALGSLALGLEGRGFDLELARARSALGDLGGARGAARSAATRAEHDRVARVLCNLVANAVEHGGQPVVVRSWQRGSVVQIEVADSGQGFARVRRTPARPGRGRGLGIVSRAVRDAGGNLSISTSDEGSTVAVELPVAQ